MWWAIITNKAGFDHMEMFSEAELQSKIVDVSRYSPGRGEKEGRTADREMELWLIACGRQIFWIPIVYE